MTVHKVFSVKSGPQWIWLFCWFSHAWHTMNSANIFPLHHLLSETLCPINLIAQWWKGHQIYWRIWVVQRDGVKTRKKGGNKKLCTLSINRETDHKQRLKEITQFSASWHSRRENTSLKVCPWRQNTMMGKKLLVVRELKERGWCSKNNMRY